MDLKGVITDLIQKDADPAAYADIRWFEVCVRRIFDHQCLKAFPHRQPQGKAAIFVVVVDKRGEDTLVSLDEKRRHAVREFFRHARERRSHTPNSRQVSCGSPARTLRSLARRELPDAEARDALDEFHRHRL